MSLKVEIAFLAIALLLNIFSQSLFHPYYIQRRGRTLLNSAYYPEGSESPLCRIKVIGVGGGGSNSINRIKESFEGVPGVEFWVVNTDAQALSRSSISNKLNIGASISRGLGAGGNPEVGRQAAIESRKDILEMVRDAELVFVTAGMGGGTGSGAAPIVAECAKESGALTVGVVTKPFGFEGRKRMQQAQGAISLLKSKVDTLVVISNDKLLQTVPENTPLTEAFLIADDIIRQGVVGVSEVIIKPGLINVDFADVRAIMCNAGMALMGIGKSNDTEGDRAVLAATAAMNSPLLDFPITKARGIVFNVVGGNDMTLQEVNRASKVIYESADPDANIIFGALVDDKITNGEISVTVLATGFHFDPVVSASSVLPASRKSALPTPKSVLDTLGVPLSASSVSSSRNSIFGINSNHRDSPNITNMEDDSNTLSSSSTTTANKIRILSKAKRNRNTDDKEDQEN